MLNYVREAWYGRLLDIGHHSTLGQMETVQSHTRIALFESLSLAVLGLSIGRATRAVSIPEYST